jgi:cell division protein FtsQ
VPLRRRIEAITARKDDGIVVQLHEGPELIFGDGRQAEAKWIAATRVLADPEAEGATYIDVRLPGRPAAGGVAASTVTPVAPAGAPVAPVTGALPTDAAAPVSGATPPASGAPVTPATPVTPQATTPPATMPATPTPTTPVEPQTPVTPASGVAGGAGAPASP